jgi:hypothetical protein
MSCIKGGMAVLALAVLVVVCSTRTQAAEGGASMYIPGAAGDIAIAASSAPGLSVATKIYIQESKVDRAVLQGAVNLDAEISAVLGFAAAGYTFHRKVLGANYTIGALLAYGNVDIEAALEVNENRVGVSGDATNLADGAVIPLQLNWDRGFWHYKIAEAIVIPMGDYDLSNNINLGRNYWAFDTVAALTWLNTNTGTEFSAEPGLMFNTENSDTDYKTGTEFHLDFVANQFLSERFAFGLRGYYYRQVTGDSGTGARLGDFKSEAFGLGPGIFWTPRIGKGRFVVIAKWMHDLTSTNRLEADYYQIGIALTPPVQ